MHRHTGKWRCATALAFLEVISSLSFGNAYCPEDEKYLSDQGGLVKYNSIGKAEYCEWIFPYLESEEVLFLHVNDIDMTYPAEIDNSVYQECSGRLALPELSSYCERKWADCIFYKIPSSPCDVEQVLTRSSRKFNCSTWSFHVLNELPKGFSVYTYRDYGINFTKSFSLHYEYMSCLRNVTAATTAAAITESETTTTPAGNPTIESHGITEALQNSKRDTTLMAIVIAILGAALIGSWIYFAWSQRARKKSIANPSNEIIEESQTREVVVNEVYQSYGLSIKSGKAENENDASAYET